jgi:hypothetical protein
MLEGLDMEIPASHILSALGAGESAMSTGTRRLQRPRHAKVGPRCRNRGASWGKLTRCLHMRMLAQNFKAEVEEDR